MKHYTERDIEGQGQWYSNHTNAMTSEGLNSKSRIAAELAHRDMEIAAMGAVMVEMIDFELYTEFEDRVEKMIKVMMSPEWNED